MQFLEVADVQGCEHIFVDIMRLIYGCNYFLVSSFFHDWIENAQEGILSCTMPIVSLLSASSG